VILAFEPANRKARPPQSMVIITVRERDSEAAGMAAPVFAPGGNLHGAISLSGPATRFQEAAFPKLAKALLAAASDLTNRLGGDPTPLQQALINAGNGKRLIPA
jgi:hypothetical protein